MTARTLVLGIGNILLGDEGIGVRVVEAMRDLDLPAGVELADGGTMGPALADLLEGRDKVIVIDAVTAGGPPGAIYRLTAEDLLAEDGRRLSLHELGLVEALRLSRQAGRPPLQVVVLGVQPAEMSWGLALSPRLQATIPRLIELVRAELLDKG